MRDVSNSALFFFPSELFSADAGKGNNFFLRAAQGPLAVSRSKDSTHSALFVTDLKPADDEGIKISDILAGRFPSSCQNDFHTVVSII